MTALLHTHDLTLNAPGGRALLQRPEPPELFSLDEPTSHLDFLGQAALQQLLARWPGGLVVASHDRDFMHAIRLDTQLPLTAASHR